ncbi:hypothetical protein GGS20DRAFT_41489 [Poronia punctata]|nr:hypothetical protein GGS20DRAFT_41489 [Poronia punctata]
MSLNSGARLVRLHQALLRHGTSSSSTSTSTSTAIGLRLSLESRQQIHTSPRTSPSRPIFPPENQNNKTTTQRRLESTSTSTSTTPQKSTPKNPEPSASELETAPPPQPQPPSNPLSDPLNPPASTRPPPLNLPAREKDEAFVKHLFKVGKTYLSFYWAGIKAIFANRRLLKHDRPGDATRPGTKSTANKSERVNPSRSLLLLRSRVRHDMTRLPFFALVVLVCGEFTPIIVLLFPRMTPYTCRIPQQMSVIRKSVEARRAASFRALAHVDGYGTELSPALEKVADGHICRSLNRGNAIWDKVGFDVPFASSHAARAIRHIVADDALIREGGDVGALVDDEVVLACEDRGIDTLGKEAETLREQLGDWIAKSAPTQTRDAKAAMEEASLKVRRLLLGLDR